MNKPLAVLALLGALVAAPALASSEAHDTTVAALPFTKASPKPALKKDELAEQNRRKTAYRAWYHTKYGYDPDDQQVRAWYSHAYGIDPS